MIRMNEHYGIIDIVVCDDLEQVRQMAAAYNHRPWAQSKACQVEILALIERVLNPNSEVWV